MLNATELFTLARDLTHRRVLSVYIDNWITDPARRAAWRTTTEAELRRIRDTIGDGQERAHFDRAVAHVKSAQPRPGGMWAARGWTAWATSDGLVYVGELPRRIETFIAWQDGPAIAPYLRALKQHTPVIVALVHGRGAHVYRYVHGALESVEELGVSLRDEGAQRTERTAASREGRGYPAPRSALNTEMAQRRQRAEFQRFAPQLAGRLTLLGGSDAFVLIGGAGEWTRLAAAALPRRLRDRLIVSELDPRATRVAITRAAKNAARELRSRRGRALISRVLARVEYRAVASVPAVQRGLHVKAVDLLLVSSRFLHVEGARAEKILHAALRQGARIEVLSGDAGVLLDRVADGVAARLRFAIDAPLRHATHHEAIPSSPPAS